MGKKYFVTKLSERLIEIDNINSEQTNNEVFFNYLLASLQVKTDSYEWVSYEKDKKSCTIDFNKIFPRLYYSIKSKNEESIDYIDIAGRFEINKNDTSYLTLVFNAGVYPTVYNPFFRSVSGDILDKNNSIKMEYVPVISDYDIFISDLENENLKNNNDMVFTLSDMNGAIINVLHAMSKHFDLEFLIKEVSFAPIIGTKSLEDYGKFDNKEIEFLKDFDSGRIFKEITDKETIEKYLVRENFK